MDLKLDRLKQLLPGTRLCLLMEALVRDFILSRGRIIFWMRVRQLLALATNLYEVSPRRRNLLKHFLLMNLVSLSLLTFDFSKAIHPLDAYGHLYMRLLVGCRQVQHLRQVTN